MDVGDDARMLEPECGHDVFGVCGERGGRGRDGERGVQLRCGRGIVWAAELCCERRQLCDGGWAELRRVGHECERVAV